VEDLQARLNAIAPGELDAKCDRDLDKLGVTLWWLEAGGASCVSGVGAPAGLPKELKKRWRTMDQKVYAVDYSYSFKTACALANVTESRMRRLYPDVVKEVEATREALAEWSDGLRRAKLNFEWVEPKAGDPVVSALLDSLIESLDLNVRSVEYESTAREADLRNRERALDERLPPQPGTLVPEYDDVPDEARQWQRWGFPLDVLPVAQDQVPWWTRGNASVVQESYDSYVEGETYFGVGRRAGATLPLPDCGWRSIVFFEIRPARRGRCRAGISRGRVAPDFFL
jgi:hypothetical protein